MDTDSELEVLLFGGSQAWLQNTQHGASNVKLPKGNAVQGKELAELLRRLRKAIQWHMQGSLTLAPRNLPTAGVKAHPFCTLTSFMKVSMTDPTCPYSPLSSLRTRLECRGLVGVLLSILLRSCVALLAPRQHRELLESLGLRFLSNS